MNCIDSVRNVLFQTNFFYVFLNIYTHNNAIGKINIDPNLFNQFTICISQTINDVFSAIWQ